jgi:hypothetical protein
MTFNFRIMRRYQPESPETYWFEVVEVFYGEDGIPMMWSEAGLPFVDDLGVDVAENIDSDFELETFVKESLIEGFTMMMRDVDSRGPILDQRDFEDDGVYANHPEYEEMLKQVEEIKSKGYGDNSETGRL